MKTKTLQKVAMVAFSIFMLSNGNATDRSQLQPIEEIENVNGTSNWMQSTKMRPSQKYQAELAQQKTNAESTDVCIYATNKTSAELCEYALACKASGKSAIKPVELMIQAALAESNDNVRKSMIEFAAQLAAKRMNAEAFNQLLEKQIQEAG